MKELLFAMSLVANAPTASDTFAIACNGEIFSTTVEDGKVITDKSSLPDQIFVFSENSEVALRAMPRRKEFEKLCEIGSSAKEIDFSPDMIRVYWTSGSDWKTKTTCEFKFNRSEGMATLRTKFEWSDFHHNESEWRMICTPTQIPVFDLDER